MAEINRITSFKTFSEIKATQVATQLAEENATKRSEIATKIASLLDEMEINSFDELEEDTKREFITRAFGNVSEEEVEVEVEVSDEVEDEEESDEVEESVEFELNEAIIVTGKRGAKKVFNQLVKIWNEYPAFGANDQSHKLGVLKQLFFDAMEDANFSREAYAIMKTIKGNIKPVTIKVAELGGAELKLPMPKIREAISELASRIATAGDWGGITIVEGTAMFLDYLKETKTAENLLNGFNAQFESVQIMESRVSEGRAFVAAARKAKDEGLEEFEYEGKTFPVLLKETKAVLNEGTRGQFGKIDKKGNITSVYMHYDSYPDNILPIIKQSFKGGKNVDTVISKGNNSGLDKNVDAINYYNDDTSGEKGNVKKIDQYLKTAADESGAEYVYLWDEGSKTWMMADIYGDSGLVPAFESVQVEEGNAFGDAVKKAKEAGETEFEFEGETFKVEESEEVPVIESCETCGEQTCECSSEEVEEAKVNENPALVALAAAELLKKKEEEARPEDEEEEVNAEEDEVEEDELEESEVNEAEIKSDEEFTEYANTVLQKAFGEDFDEAKAKEVIDGILSKSTGDYGAAVGMLQSSLA